MLRAAVICPPSPVLLPGISGSSDPARCLRAASVAAVGWLLDQDCTRLVVVAPAAVTRTWPSDAPFSTGVFTGAGGPARDQAMPVSLAVARHLLELADGGSGVAAATETASLQTVTFQTVALDADPESCRRLGSDLVAGPEPVGLLVMADGTIDHDLPDPPEPLTEADAYDAALVRALREVDPEQLRGLDGAIAHRWGSSGWAAVQVLVGGCATPPREGEVTYADAPFGVFYVVASWDCAGNAGELARRSQS